MENASKALIIAGAVLLAILLISMAIMILNQGVGLFNNNDATTEMAVTSFNQKFEQYLGDNVRGANVNSLLNAIKTNNMSTDDTSRQISITGACGTDASAYTKAATGSTYKVTVTKYTSGGLIQTIDIKLNQ